MEQVQNGWEGMGQFSAESRAKLKQLSHPLTPSSGRRIKKMKLMSTWEELTAELREWVYSTLFKTPAASYTDPIMQYKHVNIMLLTTDYIFGDTDDNNYFSMLDASSKFLQLLWWNEEENCVHSVLPLANRLFNSRVLYFLMFFIMKHNTILMAKRYKDVPRSYFCLDRWEGRQRKRQKSVMTTQPLHHYWKSLNAWDEC